METRQREFARATAKLCVARQADMRTLEIGFSTSNNVSATINPTQAAAISPSSGCLVKSSNGEKNFGVNKWHQVESGDRSL